MRFTGLENWHELHLSTVQEGAHTSPRPSNLILIPSALPSLQGLCHRNSTTPTVGIPGRQRRGYKWRRSSTNWQAARLRSPQLVNDVLVSTQSGTVQQVSNVQSVNWNIGRKHARERWAQRFIPFRYWTKSPTLGANINAAPC